MRALHGRSARPFAHQRSWLPRNRRGSPGRSRSAPPRASRSVCSRSGCDTGRQSTTFRPWCAAAARAAPARRAPRDRGQRPRGLFSWQARPLIETDRSLSSRARENAGLKIATVQSPNPMRWGQLPEICRPTSSDTGGRRARRPRQAVCVFPAAPGLREPPPASAPRCRQRPAPVGRGRPGSPLRAAAGRAPARGPPGAASPFRCRAARGG